ncbi:MAG TPA: hypothetical protein V6C78_25530 [Crinalium sp.]|jgi:hypothetical protein
MATTKKRSQSGSTRRSASSTVPKTVVEQATLSLVELPDKPKEHLQIREAVEQMLDTILVALSKGYSHEDVASLLRDKGLDITPSSLKYYLSRFKKKQAAAPSKPRKTRRTKASAGESEADAPVVAAEAPAKKTRRTSTKVQEPAKAAPRRAAAKSKATAAETSVTTVEPAAPAAEAPAPAKKRSPRSATQTKTKAPAAKAPTAKAKAATPSTRSRKKS